MESLKANPPKHEPKPAPARSAQEHLPVFAQRKLDEANKDLARLSPDSVDMLLMRGKYKDK